MPQFCQTPLNAALKITFSKIHRVCFLHFLLLKLSGGRGQGEAKEEASLHGTVMKLSESSQ